MQVGILVRSKVSSKRIRYFGPGSCIGFWVADGPSDYGW
jgi:hypothetical protein